jgi:TonB-linked SusC/RagA family outer membrane protein
MPHNYLNRKIVRPLILLIALTAGGQALAQTQPGITRGVVRDDFGKPLSRARIQVKGTQVLVETDTTGSFAIEAAPGRKLVISHAGFNPAERQIKDAASLQVQLSPAYLQAPQKLALLHKDQDPDAVLQAVATVHTPQLTTTPAPSFLQALPGRLPGLYTRQRSGVQDNDAPASVMDFQIRGQNPLILVDGVPRDYSSLEPESIESISVLKDALATVMYGQRSSDNIILVTTKRPGLSPFRLSATVQQGVQSLLNLPQPVSAADFALLYNEARRNDGMPAVYTAPDIAVYRDGTDPLGHPDINWQHQFLRKNAVLNRYNLNIQSGSKTARFYVALDYQNEGGFFKTSGINTYNTNANVDRYIVRSNVSLDLNKSLNVGLNIFGRIQNGNQPGDPADASAGSSGLFSALSKTPNIAYPVFNANGSLAGNTRYSKNISGLINNAGYTLGTTRDLSADIALTQKLDKFLTGLWVKGNVSYNNTVDQTVNRSKDFAVFRPLGAETYQQIGANGAQRSSFAFNSRRTATYNKLSFGYDKRFGHHSLTTQVLADQQATTTNLNLPATYTNYATNLSYQFKEKYFAEVAGSYGGFNRYKPGDRFGLFYAAGLGWNLAKESFLAGQPWLNTLKPRISYGRTGNAAVGYYVYKQYYAGTGINNVYYFGGTAPAGVRGFNELDLANRNATWEKANKLNIGLDAELWAKKLQFRTEYFHDTYFDLVQTRGTSSQIIGQNFPLENMGRNRYTGFENSLSWQGQAGAFTYFAAANASALKTKVLYQDEVYRPYDYQQRTGLPVGQAFGYIAEAFFQSPEEINANARVDGYTPVPGDIRYRDLNEDGIINQLDETAIGTQKPLVYYGFTTGFRIKGFDLSVSFQGVANRDIILSGDLEYEFQNNGDNQAFRHHLNRWTPYNTDQATYPRLTVGTNVNNHRSSTFWVHSADYLRLQNVDLGYTLPAFLTRGVKVNAIRLFANGFNLYSFDSLDHNDPENNNSVFPLRRAFNAGVNIKL